eukprot:TRINITY_DN10273_c0_g1_i5.p1 TRINITY_DN10273_c0_g1~~TRINITY_DN10273_c0_g1_i5.p1  ORF type:complete len:214 (-),score=15.54 TRINITY_DN10273_c0_g1_i5:1099-1740(-)
MSWFEMDMKSLEQGENLYDEWRDGTYKCIGCDTDLYGSADKYRAKCRWPQFRQARPASVTYRPDNSFAMNFNEIVCANPKCGQIVGHLFLESTSLSGDDPCMATQERHCVMSQSLRFVPREPDAKNVPILISPHFELTSKPEWNLQGIENFEVVYEKELQPLKEGVAHARQHWKNPLQSVLPSQEELSQISWITVGGLVTVGLAVYFGFKRLE